MTKRTVGPYCRFRGGNDEQHRHRRDRETRAEVRRIRRPCPRIRDFWLAHTATDTWNAACPPGVTISDVNHGAGGPECGKSMIYWLWAVVSFLAAAWAIVAWVVMWIVSLLTVVRK
jgi:hypothetical protein